MTNLKITLKNSIIEYHKYILIMFKFGYKINKLNY